MFRLSLSLLSLLLLLLMLLVLLLQLLCFVFIIIRLCIVRASARFCAGRLVARSCCRTRAPIHIIPRAHKSDVDARMWQRSLGTDSRDARTLWVQRNNDNNKQIIIVVVVVVVVVVAEMRALCGSSATEAMLALAIHCMQEDPHSHSARGFCLIGAGREWRFMWGFDHTFTLIVLNNI